MKKADIAMIILVSAISIGVAIGVVGAIPGLKQSSEAVEVDTIEKYEATIDEPDGAVFNKSAINPTVDITIGGTSSPELE